MLLFFGKGEGKPKTVHIPECSCKYCNTNTVEAFVTWRYFHIYWIPFIPYWKTIHLRCTSCGEVFEDAYKKLHKHEYQFYTKSIFPYPYMFSGSIILVILIMLIAGEIREDKVEAQRMLANPQVRDCYVLKLTSDNPLQLMAFYRVIGISQDSVRLLPAVRMYDLAQYFEQDCKRNDTAFSGYWDPTGIYSVERDWLIDAHQNGQVKEVWRPETNKQ